MQVSDRYRSRSHAAALAGAGDDAGRDDVQNSTVASSDWSVRPSDDSAVDSTSAHANNYSRLNPAATPFSFAGVGTVAGVSGDLPSGSAGGGGGAGGGHGSVMNALHRTSVMAGAGMEGNASPMNGGAPRGMGSLLNSSGKSASAAAAGMDVTSPTSYNLLPGQGMMGVMPYMMGGGSGGGGGAGGGGGGGSVTGGHGANGSRPAVMMDFAQLHSGGLPSGIMSGGGGGGNRLLGSGGGAGGGSGHSSNNFLPPPGEDTDQQELVRLQQINYRVKMLPPPLTYAVHRRIWAKNEYGDDDEDNNEDDEEEEVGGGGVGDRTSAGHLSGGFIAHEDPVDKEQRLEAYHQIMQRWYARIHVLEGKPEVAKRLVRVRRSCPSLDDAVRSLAASPPFPASAGGGGNSEMAASALPPTPSAAAAMLSPQRGDGAYDFEEILATWSALCWDWWQETVKRKPRRARKQGEAPATTGNGGGIHMSPSTSAIAAMDDDVPSRNVDALDAAAAVPPSLAGGGGAGALYTRQGAYSHPHDSVSAATGGGMPMALSYKSFTELSEERLRGSPTASAAGAPHSFGHHSPHHSNSGDAFTSAPPSQAAPRRSLSRHATPPTSVFTTNGARAAALRGHMDEILDNDHLTLAFTAELLKALEE